MFSIGTLAKLTGVKVPTIRYYEQIGLISPAARTQGNQRRYAEAQRARLGFIKHARELGFSIEAIAALIELNDQPERDCSEATAIARSHLADVRAKIATLLRLESELVRITEGCSGAGVVGDCYVMAALADHRHSQSQH